MPESIHYDKHITSALRLDNQRLKLNVGGQTEEKTYLDPKGVEIIELLDDTNKNERKVLGHCTFKYYEEPFPFYYVSWVIKKNPKDNFKVGDAIMERINTFIKAKNLPAFLGVEVLPGKPPEKLYALYERLGWKKIALKGQWMEFNLTPDITQENIIQAINKIKETDPHYALKKSHD